MAALEGELFARGLRLLGAHWAGGQASDLQEAFALLLGQGVRGIICWEESASAARAERATLDVPLLPIGFTHEARPGVWLDLAGTIDLAVGGQQARSAAFIQACQRRELPPPTIVAFEGECWDLEAASRGAREGVEAWDRIQ